MNDVRRNPDNNPPNSRLFIVCGKSVTEDDFRETFDSYGSVESVEIHKDRKGDSKGIAYIKFSKTSEAALAVEEMNGRCIGQHPRPLKVMIAHSKDQGKGRESNEEERLLRLFVVISKDLNEEDLKNYFNNFGTVQYVNIIKDRDTKESKGYAFIKFYRLVHAAKAFELCDKSYKAVFAEPRPLRTQQQQQDAGVHHNNPNYSHHQTTNGFHHQKLPTQSSSVYQPVSPALDCSRLTVYCSLSVNEDQLWRLFDLIPGLDYCEVREVDQPNHRVVGLVVYTNPTSAAYARKKLHGFEYPPGHRLIVRHEDDSGGSGAAGGGRMTASSASSSPPPVPGSTLQSLAESIAQATSLIQAANFHDRVGAPGSNLHHFSSPSTTTVHNNNTTCYDPGYCSISLPPPQPLVPMDTTVTERLFLVCTPHPPPMYALKDVFSRFGGLIDVYLLKGKRCGYALFSSSTTAIKAKTSLNGQDVMGARLKVMLAEPTKNVEKGSHEVITKTGSVS